MGFVLHRKVIDSIFPSSATAGFLPTLKQKNQHRLFMNDFGSGLSWKMKTGKLL
jgi:hypothetical protein